jgi:hypothetical protein
MFKWLDGVTQEDEAFSDGESSTLWTGLGSEADLLDRHSVVVGMGEDQLGLSIVAGVHAVIVKEHSTHDEALAVSGTFEAFHDQW